MPNMPTFLIYPSDEKEFNSKIEPEIKEGNELTIFCSFTYITSNYSILFTLEGLKKFIGNRNYKVLLVMWDMNALSNVYFRKLQSLKKVSDADAFINLTSPHKKIEIFHSWGFDSWLFF